MEKCLKNHHKKLCYTKLQDNLALKSQSFGSKIKLSDSLILFQIERTSFFRNSTMQKKQQKYLNKIKWISVLIINGNIYICKKKNYLHRKDKDFQFFMIKELQTSKKDIYGTRCLGENVWR